MFVEDSYRDINQAFFQAKSNSYLNIITLEFNYNPRQSRNILKSKFELVPKRQNAASSSRNATNLVFSCSALRYGAESHENLILKPPFGTCITPLCETRGSISNGEESYRKIHASSS